MRRASGDRSLTFFSVKSALIHHPEGAVVSTSWLVRSARRMRLLREPPDNALAPASAAVIICASGICPAFNAVQLSDACANLPTAALSQLWTALTVRPFSFSEKKQKQGYAKVRTIRSVLCKELHKGYDLNSHPLKVKRT